jgi:tRNA 2-thiouridine synthesizing protein A
MLVIDAKGTYCPVPILRLARAAQGAPEGTEVQVVATDPAFCADVRAWCEATGHELVSLTDEAGAHRALVRLRSPRSG